MNSIFIICVLFCGGVLPSFALEATLEPFDWEKGGSYLATGTFSGRSIFPVDTNASSSPTYFAIDVTRQRYVLGINQDNVQWGFPNGTYISAINNTCYFAPATYADFLRVYRAALETSAGLLTSLGILSTYTGLIRDPATCDMYASVTLTQGIGGRIVGFGFGQVLNLAPTVGLPQGAFIPGHVAGSMRYDYWKNGSPPAHYFQLPSHCLNPVTLRENCAWYYPNGPFTTPI